MDDYGLGQCDLTSGESTEDISHPFGERQPDKKPRKNTFFDLSHQSSTTVSRSTLTSTTESLVDDFDPEEGGVSNINVVVRIRPLSDLERKRNDVSCITAQAPSTIVIENNSKSKTFTYNAIFDEVASQHDLLDKCGIKQIIEMSVEGYACTVFAYGQTGSGKTHTITGPTGKNGNLLPKVEEVGLIQRSFAYLFEVMGMKGGTFTLYMSYLEIYNEQVKDLLNPSSRDTLSVRWSKDRGFYVENLFVVECETQDDLIAVLEEGMRQKQMATTNINEHSSRSHTIMTLFVDSEMPDEEEDGLYITKRGKISFVDLAGSEKIKEIGSSSELISETTNINKSLLTLGNCISSLSDSRKRLGHIPYRESKLTKLLADSLGGTGITLMVACVSPSAYCFAESLSTLRYATRARRIKNKPVIRMDPREKLILSLKREVKLLRAENQYLRQRIELPAEGPVQMGITKEPPLQNIVRTGTDGEETRPIADENENQKVAPTTKRDTIQSLGKSAADNSIYEMIQEYMVENETLRKENVGLQSSKEQSKRDQEQLSKENEKLIRKLTHLERVISASPVSMFSLSRTTSGHSIQSQSSDQLSPFMQSPGWGPYPQTNQSPWMVDVYGYQHVGPVEGQEQGQSNSVPPVNQWRQMAPGQLPPVDNVKGMPDSYRRMQREGHQNQMMRSQPGFSVHQSVVPSSHPASKSLPATHPPHGQKIRNDKPTQQNPKNRPPDANQSHTQPNMMTIKPSMRPLQAEQGFNQRGIGTNTHKSGADNKPERGRQTQTDIYIPPLGKNSADVSDDRETKVIPTHMKKQDLHCPLRDAGSVTTKNQGAVGSRAQGSVTTKNQGAVGSRAQGSVTTNHQGAVGSRAQESVKGKGCIKKPVKQHVIQNAATGATGGGYAATGGGYAATGGGYPSKGKDNQTALKKGSKKQLPQEVDTSSTIPPPAVKYVPSGTSEMIAASSSDQSRGAPQSNSFKKINHKLREELHALDGEIEYMKYVNKAETTPNAKNMGKKR